jgi:3-hydroxyisobutyrate dehydrogenase
MCGHLLGHGYQVTVTTRSRPRAEGLLADGATWADNPAQVAEASDVVFSMVGLPDDVREVLLGPRGALSAARPGTILIDMTTSEPSLAVEIGRAAAEQGVHALDAPVSGGDIGARNASLSIMVGGPGEVFDAMRPCFEAMGTTVVCQGSHGAGQHTKMVNQILVASTMVAMAEGLLYAYRSGLDLETVLSSVASGAAASWALSNLAPRVVAGDFAPGFLVDHLVKDLGIALTEARQARLALPGLALANQLYIALQAQDRGGDGTQALVHALASLSGFDWPRFGARRHSAGARPVTVELALTPDGRWDITTDDLVIAARDAGFAALGLSAARAGLDARRALSDAGLRCHELLALLVTDDEPETVAAAEQLAEGAVALGADWVLTVFRDGLNETTARIIRRCAAIFADAGTAMAVEFSPMGPVATIADGLEIVEVAGHERAGLLIDSWHFCFGGSTWDDLARVPVERIAYIQFADGVAPESDDRMRETLQRRAMPGEGTLDLRRFADTLLGRGFDGTVSVEVLNRDLRQWPVPRFASHAREAAARYWV